MHTVQCTLHTAHYTLNTAHCTLITAHCTEDCNAVHIISTMHCNMTKQCIKFHRIVSGLTIKQVTKKSREKKYEIKPIKLNIYNCHLRE